MPSHGRLGAQLHLQLTHPRRPESKQVQKVSFRRPEYRVVLTVLSAAMLIYGIVNLLRYPVQ